MYALEYQSKQPSECKVAKESEDDAQIELKRLLLAKNQTVESHSTLGQSMPANAKKNALPSRI